MVDLIKKAQAVIEKYTDFKKNNLTTTDLTTGGGLLAPQQAMRLIRLMHLRTELLRQVRIVPMKGPTQRIDRILYTGDIMHPGTEGTALNANQHSKPTLSKLELSSTEFVAEMQITYNALEDSIERNPSPNNVRGSMFENTVIQLFASNLARNIEKYGLISETGHSNTDYAQFDGWLKLARDNASYNHGGNAVSKAFFKNLFLTLPKQYRQGDDKRNMRFIVGPNTDIEWADEQADRVTTTGDSVAWNDRHPDRAYSVPLLVSGYMPEESGASSNVGEVLLSLPKNLLLGVERNIYLELDRDIRSRTLIVVATIRIDVNYEQVEGAAVGTNVKVA